MAKPTQKSEDVSTSAPLFRRKNFFWGIVLLVFGLSLVDWFCMYYYDMNLEIPWVTQLYIILGGFGLYSIWAFFSVNGSLRSRLKYAVLPWGVLGGLLFILRPIHNGDVQIVGFRFFWNQPADQLLETLENGSHEKTKTVVVETENDFPRFLGNNYWAEVTNVALETDWKKHPPKLLWKQEIGSGWSSFSVVGNYAVTQEQRGEQELVVCYRIAEDENGIGGSVVWSYANEVRFYETIGKVGPRATPTIFKGRVFTLGGTGLVNCLDLATGKRIWSHDVMKKHGADVVTWGKSNSPLVFENKVIISVGAPHAFDKHSAYNSSLVAYDITDGKVIWQAGKRQSSYASPIETTLAGVQQILVINQDYLTSHRASDGKILWEHPWPGNSGSDASVSQPVPVGEDRVFLSKGYEGGAQLLKVSLDQETQTWDIEPLWGPRPKRVMRTKMGNVLVRDGFVYGIDGTMLECVKLSTGKKVWKKRRSPTVGHGQILLVGKEILVLTEQGEIVLIEANPKKYRELAKLAGITGVTWNSPTLAGKYLLIRNAEQVACFEMSLKENKPSLKNEKQAAL